MKNLILNYQDVIQRELQHKLNNLDKSNFDNQEDFQATCLKLAKKATIQYYKVTDLNLAEIASLRTRTIETYRDIIRLIWDLNKMNFN